MATDKTKKQKYLHLYGHLEDDLIDRNRTLRDKFNMPLYKMFCPICLRSRGFLRMQAAFLPCKKCGQKGKITGRKGEKQSDKTKTKISEANKLRNFKSRGVYRNLSNIEKKIIHSCRTRIWQALRGINKSKNTIKLIGCTEVQLKLYLQSKFLPGMTWDNYGRIGWHIDHIKPLAAFDLSNSKQQEEACHYTNLQPLWAKDNLKKSDNYV